MTGEQLRWVLRWAYATESLIFWWIGQHGLQPVLMPNSRYRWMQ